jgi:AraC-like DNA-binding protein
MSLLSQYLRTKLIPWSQQRAHERFIVARPGMTAARMPEGVVLTRKKLVGPRVMVKGRRIYGNTRNLIAEWPNSEMQETGHYKMVCVLSGAIDFRVGEQSVQCGEGFCLLLPPEMPRTTAAFNAQGKSCEALSIILRSNAVQCFVSRAEPGQARMGYIENYLFTTARLVEIMNILTQELSELQQESEHIGSELLTAFWMVLLREVELGHFITPGPMGHPEILFVEDKVGSDFKTELICYIRKRLDQNLTLEDTARSMHLSRAQFARRMRQETGKSFVQFLTDYRIDEGKMLLRESDWTIAAIAEFLGFRSPSYFQSVFRRYTGVNPGNYRSEK